MKQIAKLSPEQIDQAWEFARPIEGENPDQVRHDFVGARIHRDKYNCDDPYGWVVEYILNEKFLEDYATIDADVFCATNVRVLYFKNQLKNANNSVREVVASYINQNEQNVRQYLAPVYLLSREQLNVLKEIYGLSDEIINLL